MVLVLALVAYPFCYAIYLSMTRKFVGMPPVFVGLENYVRLASDGFFQRAVWNSVIFTFGSVIFKWCRQGDGDGLTSKIRFRTSSTDTVIRGGDVVSALTYYGLRRQHGCPQYVLVQVLGSSARYGLALRGGDAMAAVIS